MLQELPLTSLMSEFGHIPAWKASFDFCLGIMRKHEVFLAGGAARELIFGLVPTADYDFFATRAKEWYEFPAQSNLESTHAINFIENGYKVQLVKRSFGGVFETLNAFDFHVCQFAIDKDRYVTSMSAIVSHYQKNLTVHRISHARHSMSRAFKYQKKGFRVDNKCINAIMDADRTGQRFY